MVYIIILHWNNFRCTDFCLNSLRSISYKNFKILVVDNNSTDNSLEMLKNKYNEAIYLNSNENVGFARGCNLGIKFALKEKAEYILLLNNDVEVSPGFIEPLIDIFNVERKVGIVTPKILYRDNRSLIWHAGGYISLKTITPVARGYNEIDNGQYDDIVCTEWASGACCIFPAEVLSEMGLLESAYFFGQEEWDFSSKAIQLGYKIVYCPSSIVYHEVNQSTTKNPGIYAYQNVYNKFFYGKKYLKVNKFYIWALKYTIYLILFFPKKSLHTSLNSGEIYLKSAKKAALWGALDFFKGVYIDVNRINHVNEYYERKYSDNS